MTTQLFVEDGLAAWKLVMQDLRAAERQLEAARSRKVRLVAPLLAEVEGLRTRADLLLADAVHAMHVSSS